jgi:membrane protein
MLWSMLMSLKSIPSTVRDAFILLRKNDPLILASATAFFATFSLSPIIVILVSALSLYFKSENIRRQLFSKLETTLGHQTSSEIEKIVHNFMALEGNGWITIGGMVFLLFVATTLLGIIRKAIHQVWHFKRKSTVKIRYNVKERLIGLAMLFIIGLLFLVSLLLDTSLAVAREYLQELIPGVNAGFIRFINIIFSILVVTTWFTMLFKVLPEARVHWKVAFAGGLVTGLLFSAGKFVLGRLLVESSLETIFGASASIALLLLFIFYSSLIMYYGAAFTYVFGEVVNKPIRAGKYADEYEERTIEHRKS